MGKLNSKAGVWCACWKAGEGKAEVAEEGVDMAEEHADCSGWSRVTAEVRRVRVVG